MIMDIQKINQYKSNFDAIAQSVIDGVVDGDGGGGAHRRLADRDEYSRHVALKVNKN